MIRPLDVFVTEIEAALETPGVDPARRVAELLQPWLGREDLLGDCDCSPRADRYARRLIHSDKHDRFCVLALVWSPGQASPVHAHRAWCALGIHCGTLSESFFAPRIDAPPALTATLVRHPGACSHADPDPKIIHRIANAGDCPAISVHVYGVGLDAVEHGVNHVYA